MDFDQANYFMAGQTTQMAADVKKQHTKVKREAALTLCEAAESEEEATTWLDMLGLLDPSLRGVTA